MYGMTVEEATPTVDVWPDNWDALLLFDGGLRGQWRVGMNGAVGLDYSVLHRELDDLGLTGAARQRMKEDVREIEAGALEAMRKKK